MSGNDKEVQLPQVGLRPGLAEDIAGEILKLFKISLYSTATLLAFLAIGDFYFLYNKVIAPSDRLVTSSLLTTLVIATIEQTGAALSAIVFAIFKKKPELANDV